MGRKKKKQLKPWCWYCNREFDDEKILIQHQKSKHFKCTFCHKKLYTGPGLSIHSMQVHKEKIDKIPFALPHRSNVEIEIYGMEGIPDDDIKEHERQKMGKDDEVEEKQIKLDIPIANPVFHMPGIPISATGVPFIPPLAVPVMPPLQFGIGPPPILVRPTIQVPGIIQPGMPLISTIGNSVPVSLVMNTQQPTSNPIKLENTIPPPPPPPPSAVESQNNNLTNSAPTFPAYSGNFELPKVIQKVTKPTSSTQNVKVVLVHPEDDIPLEQIRMRLVKYSSFLNGRKASDELSVSRTIVSHSNSMNSSEHDNIPPPPPPSITTFSSQIVPTVIRPWLTSNINMFVKPNFGGGSNY